MIVSFLGILSVLFGLAFVAGGAVLMALAIQALLIYIRKNR